MIARSLSLEPALGLEGLEQRLERVQHLLLDLLHRLAEGRVLEVALPDDALDPRAHGPRAEDGIDEPAHALTRVALVPELGVEAPNHVVDHLAEGAIEDLEEDVPLVSEVAVERPDGDAGASGYGRRRGLVVAQLLEAGEGGLQDFLARAAAASLLGRSDSPRGALGSHHQLILAHALGARGPIPKPTSLFD